MSLTIPALIAMGVVRVLVLLCWQDWTMRRRLGTMRKPV